MLARAEHALGLAPPATTNQAAPTYAALNQQHEEYDGELWEKLRLLYKGGYELLEHAAEFIPKLPQEGDQRYQFRLQHASYVPYFGQVIGYLVAALFGREGLQVAPAGDADDPSTPGEVPDKEFYPEFASDTDLKGTSFSRLMRRVAASALIYKRGLLVVDMPPVVEDATTRADEDAQGGARAYCYTVPIDQLINWSKDERTERFRWCVLRDIVSEQPSPFAMRSTYRVRFTVWQLVEEVTEQGVNRGAFWQRWETSEIKLGKKPNDKETLNLTGSGTTSFHEIPVRELELPEALWVGNKIGPLAEEHFRRRSELQGAMAESNVEIPVVSLGPEIPAVGGAIPSSVQTQPEREQVLARYQAMGYAAIGAGDDFKFVGPSGVAFELTDTQLKELREDIYRVVTAMALSLENSAAAVGRSGESKREDRSATEQVLHALGDEVRSFATKTYGVISDARGEDVVWVAHGLDTFDVAADPSTVEQAAEVKTLAIPSQTFNKEYLTDVAFRLVPSASPETKATIKKEIDAGVDEQEAAAKLMREAMLNPEPDDDDDERDERGETPPAPEQRPGAPPPT